MSTQLSQEQMQAIDNYGESIQTLGDYITAVRKIPGMYLGPLQGAGYINQIREIFLNCIETDAPLEKIEVIRSLTRISKCR